MDDKDKIIAQLKERVQVAEKFCRFMKARDDFMMNSGIEFLKGESSRLEGIINPEKYYDKRSNDFKYTAAVNHCFVQLANHIMGDPSLSKFLPHLDNALKELTHLRTEGTPHAG